MFSAREIWLSYDRTDCHQFQFVGFGITGIFLCQINGCRKPSSAVSTFGHFGHTVKCDDSTIITILLASQVVVHSTDILIVRSILCPHVDDSGIALTIFNAKDWLDH